MSGKPPSLEEFRRVCLAPVARELLAFLLPHLRRPGLAKQLATNDTRDPWERLTEAIAKAEEEDVAPARARATKGVWQIALGIWATAERQHPDDPLAFYEQVRPAIDAILARLHATDFGPGKRKTRKPEARLRFDANDWYPLYYAALLARQRGVPWSEFLEAVVPSGSVVPYVSSAAADNLRAVKEWADLWPQRSDPSHHHAAAAVVSKASGHQATYIKRALHRLNRLHRTTRSW